MKLIEKYSEAKVKNGKSVILIKSGIFYETLNDDAYIMSYLFNYNLNFHSKSDKVLNENLI